MAVVIGEAAIAVRADASGTAKEIEDEVGPAAEKAGKEAGDKLGEKMQLGIAGAAVAIGAGFGQALEQAALGDKLAAQLGLTEDESARVGSVAGNLYADAYGDSMEGVQEAVGAVLGSIQGMSSASSADLQAVTGDALNFASAMGVEVGSAATSAGILVKTGLADSAQDAFDLMTVAAQEAGPSMVEPVLEAANEYGTNFAAMGFSGEQAMALLVDASKGGEIALDKAGDAVKEFGIRATDLGDTGAQAALKGIGLDGEEMANKLLAGGSTAQDAFQQIVSGLQGIDDPAAQASASVALFGTPLEDIGKDKLPAFLDAMAGAGGELEGVAGAADRMGDTLNDNASSNLTAFTRGLQQTFVDLLGGQVIPAVSSAVSWLQDHFGPAIQTVGGWISENIVPPLQAMAQWLGENQGVVQVLASIVGGVLVAALALWATQSVITAATNAASWISVAIAGSTGAAAAERSSLQVVIGWIAAAAAAILNGAIIVGQWILMGAQALLGAARVAAAWLIAMGPIALVIAAVVGLVALIIANWDTIVSWTKTAWEAVVGAVSAAWEWIKGAVSAALDFVVDLFLNWTLLGLIISHWDTIKQTFSDGVDAAISFLTGLPGKAIDALSSLGSSIAGVAVAAWKLWDNAVDTAVSTTLDFFRGLPGKFVSALGNLGSLLVSAGGDLIRGLVNGISGAASFVGDVAGNIVKALRTFINTQVIDRLNGLLEFSIMGVTVNPPDIPRLHSGGVFDSGQGEGLALLRDQERVVTPEQRVIADRLLTDLLGGTLTGAAATPAAAAGGGVQVVNQITQQPGESGAALAARVTQGVAWNLNNGITRRVGSGVAVLT